MLVTAYIEDTGETLSMEFPDEGAAMRYLLEHKPFYSLGANELEGRSKATYWKDLGKMHEYIERCKNG